MPDDLLIAHNPEEGTSLPYLLRLPLGPGGIVLKTRETWPRTTKVYCQRVAEWPDDAEIVERLPIRSISRRGAAIDLVLQRGRENRSQFVLTRARGREMVFWQSRRTAKQARPNVTVPRARAHGRVVDIVVDTRERYGYKFSAQQADVIKRGLPVGDYAVFDGDDLVATAERKSIDDLASSLLSGKLTYLLADLAAQPRGAVIVDSGYAALFKLEHAPAARVADAVAEAQARFPSVPIVFCETRALAQEWLYRWFGACLAERELHRAGELARTQLSADDSTTADSAEPDREPPAPRPAGPAEIRAWARSAGWSISDRGRIPAEVVAAFAARATTSGE
ncbi:ERCC4 domain-containing protein [Gordonia sp. DT30]|uniref:ERCC4 domain-containing protein n=1 Tax=Gordonia sp. DT30 TaxID=3416546 RepID=UPI003CF9FFE3